MLLPVFHTGHSRDSDRAERRTSLRGSWPSLSGPSPSSLWRCERGQTPSPKTHTGMMRRCGHTDKRTIKGMQTKPTHVMQFKEGNFYCKFPLFNKDTHGLNSLFFFKVRCNFHVHNDTSQLHCIQSVSVARETSLPWPLLCITCAVDERMSFSDMQETLRQDRII